MISGSQSVTLSRAQRAYPPSLRLSDRPQLSNRARAASACAGSASHRQSCLTEPEDGSSPPLSQHSAKLTCSVADMPTTSWMGSARIPDIQPEQAAGK